jgi:hypothetical protein
MLEIAGGVILGGLGIIVILWLIGLAASNAEEVGAGCGLILAALAVYGGWYFLDSQFPEIDWIKTAFALIGAIFLALFIYGAIISIKDDIDKGNYKNKTYKYSNIQIRNIVIVISSMIFFIIFFFIFIPYALSAYFI